MANTGTYMVDPRLCLHTGREFCNHIECSARDVISLDKTQGATGMAGITADKFRYARQRQRKAVSAFFAQTHRNQ